MKKLLIMIILTLIMMTASTTPATAMTYNFGGSSPGTFAKPTSAEPETVIGGPADESDNINRSKDSAVIPPPFGSPDANTPGTGELLTPNISGVTVSYSDISGGSATVTNTGGSGSEYHPVSVMPDIPPQVDVSYSSPAVNRFTLPDGMFYEDGSIGTLSIPRINLNNIKVYEDESLENLSRGIGHFRATSCWDGNAAFAAHNRGTIGYFGQIHTLRNGDRIEYRTVYGLRVYEVFFVGQIQETDLSRLSRTDENIVTLITCVNGIPELRWCVQAREVR